MNDLITCVIPTHNRSKLLNRAIKSVLMQSYKGIEIIVVADGCTDNTKDIINNINNDLIRYIEINPAQGANYARNIGIENARGKYIAFLDDDDEWLEKKIEKQMELFARNKNLGLVYTGKQIIYMKEEIDYSSIPNDAGDLKDKILLSNIIGTTSSVMIKKCVFEDVGKFDTQLQALQDYDLWIRICQKYTVGVIEEELIYYYNYPSTNQISSCTHKYIESYAYLEKKYNFLYKKMDRELFYKMRSNRYLQLSNKCMRNGEKNEARKFAILSLKSQFNITALSYLLLSFWNYSYVLKLRAKSVYLKKLSKH